MRLSSVTESRRKCLRRVYFFVFLVMPLVSHAQWNSLGPYGRTWDSYPLPHSLAVLDSTVFLTDGSYLYRSSDQGHSWADLKGPDYSTSGVFAAEGRLFTLGVYRVASSTDGGATWDTLFGSGSSLAAAGCLADAGGNLYVSVGGTGYSTPTAYPTGLVRTTDLGGTWQSLPSDSLAGTVDLVVATKGTVPSLSYTLFAGTDHGLYKSTDLGVTWQSVSLPGGSPYINCVFGATTLRFVHLHAVLSTIVYVASWMGEVYKSTDYGVTWSQRGGGAGNKSVGSLCLAGTSSDTLLAGTYSGAFYLGPEDSIWQPALSGIPGENIPCVAQTSSGVIARSQTLGIFQSGDGGVDWAYSSTGLEPNDVSCVRVDDSMIYAGGTTYSSIGSLRFCSWVGAKKKGDTMWRISTLTLASRLKCLTSIGPVVLAALEDGIRRSPNAGVTWATASGLPSNCTVNSIVHPTSSASIFAGTDDGVYLSNDSGSTWSKCLGAMTDSAIDVMTSTTQQIGPSKFVTLYAGGSNGKLYSSVSGGDNWQDMSVPDSGSALMALASSGAFLYAATSSHVFRTSDLGLSWQTADSGLPTKPYISTLVAENGDIVCSCAYGLYLCRDGGIWTTQNGWNLGHSIQGMTFYSDTLYAGSYDGGVSFRPFAQLLTGVGTGKSNPGPVRFTLCQNYPNPFNPSTNIGYTIASSKEQVAGSTKQVGMERVRLVVYDLLGREVAVLVDGYQTPGEHRVTFDARKLASGVYFYRLVAGGAVQTRKMALVR